MTETSSRAEQSRPLAVGAAVYLRACPFGVPGRILRFERNRAAVLWPDLGPSYIGRHKPDSLTLAEGVHDAIRT